MSLDEYVDKDDLARGVITLTWRRKKDDCQGNS